MMLTLCLIIAGFWLFVDLYWRVKGQEESP
jgi:hypothetical protein